MWCCSCRCSKCAVVVDVVGGAVVVDVVSGDVVVDIVVVL